MKKRYLAGLLVLVLIMTSLVGCSGQASTSDNANQTAPEKQIVWKVQGYTPAGTLYDEYGKRLADNITVTANS